MGNSDFKLAIQVDDKAKDIFRLPCIQGLFKGCQGNDVYVLTPGTISRSCFATMGDWLCEDHEGKWHCLTDRAYRRARRH